MVGITVTFILSFIGWDWAGSKKEDLAQWLMAGAAVATLIAAISAGVFAAGAYLVEVRREDRYLEADRRAQAERFAAWGIAQTAHRAGVVFVMPQLFLRNTSELPVYNAMVQLKFTLIVGEELYEEVDESMYPLVPPTGTDVSGLTWQETEIQLSDALQQRIEEDGQIWRDSFIVVQATTQFKDSGGRTWQRMPDGRLNEPGD